MALALMADHGLTGRFRFEFDRSVKRFGLTKQYRDGSRQGVISLSLPQTRAAERERVHQTLLHEIAHALVGCGHGHDNVWFSKAREIGYKGGRQVVADAAEQAVIASRTRTFEVWCDPCGEFIAKVTGMRKPTRFNKKVHRACRSHVTVREVRA